MAPLDLAFRFWALNFLRGCVDEAQDVDFTCWLIDNNVVAWATEDFPFFDIPDNLKSVRVHELGLLCLRVGKSQELFGGRSFGVINHGWANLLISLESDFDISFEINFVWFESVFLFGKNCQIFLVRDHLENLDIIRGDIDVKFFSELGVFVYDKLVFVSEYRIDMVSKSSHASNRPLSLVKLLGGGLEKGGKIKNGIWMPSCIDQHTASLWVDK